MVNDCILIYKDVFDFEYIFKDISEIVGAEGFEPPTPSV